MLRTFSIIGALLLLFSGCNRNDPTCQNSLELNIPARPTITVSETADKDTVILKLHVEVQDADNITIKYRILKTNEEHLFNVESNVLDTVLRISGGQWYYYDMSIYGTNLAGNGPSYNFTFGGSVKAPLRLSTRIIGDQQLIYYLIGETSQTAVISSVTIKDAYSGEILMTPEAAPGDVIDISSLQQGYKILIVVADNNTYEKQFLKRTGALNTDVE